MGSRARKRARSGGLTGAAAVAVQRAAERKQRQRRERDRDDEAAAVARECYETAVLIKDTPGDELPLVLRAPAQMIAWRAAPGIVKAAGLPKDDETLHDVAAYLVGGVVSMIATFNRKHFETWRQEADRLEKGGAPVDGQADG